MGSESPQSTSSGTPGRFRLPVGEASAGFDTALTTRVTLYLRIIFFINLAFSAVLLIVLSGAEWVAYVPMSIAYVAFAVTALSGMTWYLTARGRPGLVASIVTAAVVTIAMNIANTYVAFAGPLIDPRIDSLFAVILVSIILVLRASLIPSPAAATMAVGVISFSFPVGMAFSEVGPDWSFLIWVVVLSMVITVVTMVTSYTVYGVERRMFAAAQLGQYQIDRLLGRGGMGEVYLATHALLQRPTAVKLLRHASEGSARARFREEVQTASGLTHPNTVEIYDYGRTPGGQFYFAMEYVEGATLRDIVESTGPMPPGRVIHLMEQAAGSLGEAHGRGLVHRDVKPSNLMLCERGNIHDTLKVMDFGLVRSLTDSSSEESGLSGTPLYLAPEAILEADGAVPQSDVYALGATAYFLLSGAPPFMADNLVDVLADHLSAEPAKLECSDPTLAALVMRCLAKSPMDRPEDARQLVVELRACAEEGTWGDAQAAIWWTEHREVVVAHTSMDSVSSSATAPTRR